MDTQLTREILASGSAALGEFAKTAKTTAEHLYQVIVHQSVVEGIGTIVTIFAIFIIFLASIRPLKSLWQSAKRAEDNDNSYGSGGGYFFGASIVTVTSVITVIILIVNLGEAIKHILNPEFYAIKFILDKATGQ